MDLMFVTKRIEQNKQVHSRGLQAKMRPSRRTNIKMVARNYI
jgi:hypothetical protein